MFSHALVAVDFSPATYPMFSCLPQLRRLGTEKFTLVYVMNIGYPRAPETEHEDYYEHLLEEKKKPLEDAGFTARAEVRAGYPSQEILATAEEYEASLIVIGSHGHGIPAEIYLGSVVSDVVHRSTIPVLVLRLRGRGESLELACPAMFDHILHPTDFSPAAVTASCYVKKMAESGVGKISLMHVLKPNADEIEEHHALKRLAEMKASLKGSGAAEVDVLVLRGSPVDEILGWSEQNHVTMLALGSHGRKSWTEIFVGSVAHAVVRRAPSPVLMVRPGEMEDTIERKFE